MYMHSYACKYVYLYIDWIIPPSRSVIEGTGTTYKTSDDARGVYYWEGGQPNIYTMWVSTCDGGRPQNIGWTPREKYV